MSRTVIIININHTMTLNNFKNNKYVRNGGPYHTIVLTNDIYNENLSKMMGFLFDNQITKYINWDYGIKNTNKRDYGLSILGENTIYHIFLGCFYNGQTIQTNHHTPDNEKYILSSLVEYNGIGIERINNINIIYPNTGKINILEDINHHVNETTLYILKGKYKKSFTIDSYAMNNKGYNDLEIYLNLKEYDIAKNHVDACLKDIIKQCIKTATFKKLN